jgi:hypothetical protein
MGRNLQNCDIKKIDKKKPWLSVLALAYSWTKILEIKNGAFPAIIILAWTYP